MIVHVIAGNHEWMGEVGKQPDSGQPKWEDKKIILKNAVKLFYVNDGRRIIMNMKNLRDNNDYTGTVEITNGPGVAVMQLTALGNLEKQYMQARSNIQLVPATTKITMN